MAKTKTTQFDMLSGVKHEQSPLYLSLYAFREAVKRHMGLKRFPMVQHDDPKRALRTDKDIDYPYGYFTIQDLNIARDQQAVKTIQRMGQFSMVGDFDNSTLLKGYLFPATCTAEVHYFADDIVDAFAYAEKWGLLLACGLMNVEVEIDGHKWIVTVDDQQSPISIPTSALEDESNPARHEIVASVTLSFKVGIIKAVPKVNNEGKVTTNIEVDE